uniref:Uncharacterized protein n=1 Tax=Lygus hesperus TaxID=30085 RepID=A0A146KYG5_LYGHE
MIPLNPIYAVKSPFLRSDESYCVNPIIRGTFRRDTIECHIWWVKLWMFGQKNNSILGIFPGVLSVKGAVHFWDPNMDCSFFLSSQSLSESASGLNHSLVSQLS